MSAGSASSVDVLLPFSQELGGVSSSAWPGVRISMKESDFIVRFPRAEMLSARSCLPPSDVLCFLCNWELPCNLEFIEALRCHFSPWCHPTLEVPVPSV